MVQYKIGLVVLVSALLVGCGVPKKEHQAMMQDFEATKVVLAETQREKAEFEEQAHAQIAELDQIIASLEAEKAQLVRQLEEAQATVSLFESKTGSLQDALNASQAELDELRNARMMAERRLAMYRELATRLQSMIEAGQLAVKIRDGKMMIELADNILFDPGRTEIKPDGREALEELSTVLSEIKDRNFLVAGHTDNVPIRSARFKSNWELSTARAVEVVKFMEEFGVAPQQLAAAGYGEFDPVGDNETDEGRALNRRIEIILMPNIEELPDISEAIGDES